MLININDKRVVGQSSPLLYGHFIEHFHRQVYGGIYEPGHSLSDEDGFREDVMQALRRIQVPVLRWPGGCFVSSYHWKNGVGMKRTPVYDKAWRVEEPNTFGTDEFIRFCRKINAEPYFCTNAGTGTAVEMSDWVEYCNLETQGEFARWRITNGSVDPFAVKYWSIGNENYGWWEIGAKSAEEWARLVLESAKMIKRVDPTVELSAAALADLDWNVNLLKSCGDYLDWISIHKYWDMVGENNRYSTYEQAMAFTNDLETEIQIVRGLLTAMGLEKKIKIAFDEWNLRSWYHPNIHSISQGLIPEDYLYPRNRNDENQTYTMADAVFSACFLNACHRNNDIVGMTNFAPVVNTRGCIYTHQTGIVLRSTYHVFDLYVNFLGNTIVDMWGELSPGMTVVDKWGHDQQVRELDVLATKRDDGIIAVSAINKNPDLDNLLTLAFDGDFVAKEYRMCTVNGNSANAYNTVNDEQVTLTISPWRPLPLCARFALEPHSVNVIQIKSRKD